MLVRFIIRLSCIFFGLSLLISCGATSSTSDSSNDSVLGSDTQVSSPSARSCSDPLFDSLPIDTLISIVKNVDERLTKLEADAADWIKNSNITRFKQHTI